MPVINHAWSIHKREEIPSSFHPNKSIFFSEFNLVERVIPDDISSHM